MNRCPLCPRHRAIVPPVGPTPCRVMFIAEAPSYEEDKRGEPLVGKTGIEFTGTYLPIVGLPRSEVFITNSVLCSRKGYENPTPEEAMSCSSVHLGQLLSEVKPEIIVPMGVIACSLFPEIGKLSLQHGRPLPGKWGSWSGILFPMYHPSAGLKPGGTGFMIAMMQDMEDLRKLLLSLGRGEFEWPIDPHPEPDYRFIRTEKEIHEYMNHAPRCGDQAWPQGEDTESLPDGSPFCLTFSHTPGTGRLIYTRDTHLIDSYRKLLHELLPLQLFHNYLHDAEVFDALRLPTEPFLDIMVRAYNLCLGGGGDDEDEGESRAGRGSLSLKVLAYRYCQMRMTSFKDTVWPHSIPHVLAWLKQGREMFAPDSDREPVCVCGCLQRWHEPRGKTGKQTGPCLNCKQQERVPYLPSTGRCKKWSPVKPVKVEGDKTLNLLHRKLGTVITALETGKDVDPWKRIREWPDYDQNTLQDVLGPPPVPSIEHVPEPELLTYATKDSDSTLRLYLKMQNMKPWIFYD